MVTDVLVVGSGCAGLYCAINLPSDKKVTLITKEKVFDCDSYLAQGGICMLRDESDFEDFYNDTLKAGHFENNPQSVSVMIKSSPDVLKDLLSFGVDFARNENGELLYTKEGAHSKSRILFHKDVTGKEITEKLYAKVKTLANVTVLEETELIDIIERENRCLGAVVKDKNKGTFIIKASTTVLATGGVGGLYKHSTNFKHLTGDAVAIAIRHSIALKDVGYVQIHPTTLYSEKNGERSFLISESVRGEGAKLYGKDMKRFANELMPRDLLTNAIYEQMEKDGTEYVFEDLRTIPETEVAEHFPNIVKRCKEQGYDVYSECIPVVPAQHYFMGGIKIDTFGRTSMKNLYAVGETACNGVHGRNRLASNSLLESLVFSKRAALSIKNENKTAEYDMDMDLTKYNDIELFKDENKNLVLSEINKKCEDKNMFDPITLKLQVEPLILSALKEDITSEDVSTNSVMPSFQMGEVDLICKEDGIICGLQVFERSFTLLDEKTEVDFFAKDGDFVKNGMLVARVRGDIRTLLCAERTALNFLQRMSGIATYTKKVADLLKDSKTTLLDTRKTTPNNRIFEKYSVTVGGGKNHRYNLSDGVLLKDNHIGAAGGVREAVFAAKKYAPFVRKIEVEVETLDMVKEAVEAGADIIMLDNMTHEQIKTAMEIIDGRAEVEVSGNITKENIAALTDLGVDYISSGALTHSAPIMDLSLKNLHAI